MRNNSIISHVDLLEEYKKGGKAAELVEEYRPLIYKIAQLSRGIYQTQDATYRWFYGMFRGGKVKDMATIEEIAETIHMATNFIGFRDCYHQAICFFLSMAKSFERYKRKRKKPYLPFKKYIRIALAWKMHAWLERILRDAGNVGLIHTWPPTEEYLPDIEPFTMNLDWIINGSKSPLFRGLKPYNRYLLYLYFVEGYSIVEIADKTSQSKRTVEKYLRNTMDLLKKNAGVEKVITEQ